MKIFAERRVHQYICQNLLPKFLCVSVLTTGKWHPGKTLVFQMLQRLIRSSLFLTAFGFELRNARWDKAFKPLDVGPDGSCSINEGNKSGEQKLGVEEARG